jgi:hypothetical protein
MCTGRPTAAPTGVGGVGVGVAVPLAAAGRAGHGPVGEVAMWATAALTPIHGVHGVLTMNMDVGQPESVPSPLGIGSGVAVRFGRGGLTGEGVDFAVPAVGHCLG